MSERRRDMPPSLRGPAGALLLLARIRASGIQMLPDQSELFGGGRRSLLDAGTDPHIPTRVGPNLLDADAGMEARQLHLSAPLVESVDAQAGHHDRRSGAPARRARARNVTRAGDEVDPLDEGA